MERSTSTLCSLLRKYLTQWPPGARCAYQNENGEILFWSAPPDIVRNIVKKPNPYQYSYLQKHSLCLIDTLFDDNGHILFASDKQLSVVTLEDFVGA
ncbi:hypothetical protein ACRTC3_11670 [Photobacterium damselae]|uniref:hypothetical protein n=1 Tax=Photobacterium damselae TaxID=38293 RepID=UPI003D7EEF89